MEIKTSQVFVDVPQGWFIPFSRFWRSIINSYEFCQILFAGWSLGFNSAVEALFRKTSLLKWYWKAISRFQVVGRIGVALRMRKRRTHQFLFHLEQLPAKLLAIQLLNQSNISYSILYYEKTLSPSISKQLFYFASFCFVITITAFDYYSVGLPRREYF